MLVYNWQSGLMRSGEVLECRKLISELQTSKELSKGLRLLVKYHNNIKAIDRNGIRA